MKFKDYILFLIDGLISDYKLIPPKTMSSDIDVMIKGHHPTSSMILANLFDCDTTMLKFPLNRLSESLRVIPPEQYITSGICQSFLEYNRMVILLKYFKYPLFPTEIQMCTVLTFFYEYGLMSGKPKWMPLGLRGDISHYKAALTWLRAWSYQAYNYLFLEDVPDNPIPADIKIRIFGIANSFIKGNLRTEFKVNEFLKLNDMIPKERKIRNDLWMRDRELTILSRLQSINLWKRW